METGENLAQKSIWCHKNQFCMQISLQNPFDMQMNYLITIL